MKDQRPAYVIAIVLLLASIWFCPMVRDFLGLATGNTVAVKIYYWYVSIFLGTLSALTIPGWPKVIRASIKVIALVLLISGSVELASALAYKTLFGHWSHSQYMNLNRYMFRSHPYLVGSLIEGANHQREDLLYAHNSLGYRGAEFTKEKPEGKIRIATIGGSTTYGVGVNNEETWPYHLAGTLGSNYQVLNMGVPGYSSAENLIQTALHLSDYQPDLAVYFIGLNDLRNINVQNLQPDYSDYHAPALYGALGLCSNENVPAVASIKMALILAKRAGLIEGCPNQGIDAKSKKHNGVDERAISLYERNLRSIAALCGSQGVNVLFVPQILLEEVLRTGNYNWWIPYVPTSEMDDMMVAYNEVLKGVSEDLDLAYAEAVIDHGWKKSDFVDMSHFNGSANQILAEILATQIRSIAEVDTANSQEVPKQ